MVSKVAVMALVGILAVPILLGYALNLQEVTETDYQTTGDSVNVTPLLQNGIDYTEVNANIYQLNSNFGTNYVNSAPINPLYNRISSVKSSLPYEQGVVPNWMGGYAYSLDNYYEYDILTYYTNTPSTYISLYFYENGDNVNPTFTVNRFISFKFTYDDQTVKYSYYTGGGSAIASGSHQFTNLTAASYGFNGLSQAWLSYGFIQKSNNYSFINVAKGYYFDESSISNITPTVHLPDNTKSFIMTIDLDSITDANFTQLIEVYPDAGSYVARLQLTKTTVGSNVSWQVATGFSLGNITDLHYDPTKTNNSYQLYVKIGDKVKTTTTNESATVEYSLKYVGDWPTAIGSANPYLSYDFQSVVSAPIANNFYNGLANISFVNNGSRSPTIRMDNAVITGYEVPVFVDKEYNPAEFRNNPSTVIKDVNKYGPSFTFGGNNYTVSKGNITLGSHKVPVEGLVLSSVLNSDGEYDNMIGNTLISTTPQPSTITFNGHWAASVSTTAQESYTYSKTEWVAGQFGWDGLDHNFLIVGLITSLGAFIGLGIYARRTRTSIWPLIIVCGCAAVLFFIML